MKNIYSKDDIINYLLFKLALNVLLFQKKTNMVFVWYGKNVKFYRISFLDIKRIEYPIFLFFTC